MARLETVVHATRSVHQAEELLEALEAAGIEARVADAPATDQPAARSEHRVLVAEQDALLARQIAGEFVRGGSPAPPASGKAVPDSGSLPDWWPKCPGCQAPRSASCPICGTSGTRFQSIDMGFSLIEGLDAAAAGPGASCGPGGCSPGEPAATLDPEADAGEEDGESAADMAAGMVICPTCDEPFEPQHPKRCEWCGHEFPDGFEVEPPDEAADHDEFSGRVYAVIGLLLIVVLAAALYFGLVVY